MVILCSLVIFLILLVSFKKIGMIFSSLSPKFNNSGHVSQFPQLLKGFGIETAMIGRGAEHTGVDFPSEAFWSSPDGSKVRK